MRPASLQFREFYNLPKLTDKVFLGHSPLLSSLPDGVALPGYCRTTKEELVVSRYLSTETISSHQQSEKTLIYLRREGLDATLRKVTVEPSCSSSDPNAVSTFSNFSVKIQKDGTLVKERNLSNSRIIGNYREEDEALREIRADIRRENDFVLVLEET
ncbi:hypothetical protein J6590_099015 [Homalodisca vitripennis]|nr:hypothetical protein J6590_099015 [Homalodisca vitripennis]